MLHEHVKKYNSPIHGRGLKADAFIPKGTVVWTLDQNNYKAYTAEELRNASYEVQELAYQDGDRYILSFDDGEFMNHGCDPNTGFVNHTHVALRDIQPGDEVTYDYATQNINPEFNPPWECLCGSPHCRKTITADDCLDLAFQKKFEGFLPPHVLVYIREHSSTPEKNP